MRTLIFVVLLSLFTINAVLAEGFVIDTSQCTVYVKQEPAPAYCPPPVPVAVPTCSSIWTRAKRQEVQCMTACSAPIPPCAPVCQVPVQAYVPPPQPCPQPSPSPCPPPPCNPSRTSTRFGFMFDPEIRAAFMSDQDNNCFENHNFDVDVPPIVSLLTPGIGLQFGNQECGLFRLGVRPEFILSPHCDNDCDDFFNNRFDNRNRFGIRQWVVPEFLAEYRKLDWTLGAAYKQYGIDGCGLFGNNVHLADLNTLSVYGKYKGFLLGANINSGSNNNHFIRRPIVNNRLGVIFGYGYPF